MIRPILTVPWAFATDAAASSAAAPVNPTINWRMKILPISALPVILEPTVIAPGYRVNSRRGRPHRVCARLQAWARRHCFEAPRFQLSFRPLAVLDQVKEPTGTGRT